MERHVGRVVRPAPGDGGILVVEVERVVEVPLLRTAMPTHHFDPYVHWETGGEWGFGSSIGYPAGYTGGARGQLQVGAGQSSGEPQSSSMVR